VKLDLILPLILIGVVIPILFSPIMIQGIEQSYYQVEVEFQYQKNPTELKPPTLIQLPTNHHSFTNFISGISELQTQEEYSDLIPPDILQSVVVIELTDTVEIGDELTFVLEKSD